MRMTEDLAEIREEKKAQMKKKLSQKEQAENLKKQQEQQKKQMEAMKKQMLKQILTNEARERLGRIRAADKERANKIETILIRLHKSGRIKEGQKIDDETLKQLLKQISKDKKEINITWK